MDVKQLFSNMMKRVQPWILSHFIMWLDLKIAEYKVLGYMVLGKFSILKDVKFAFCEIFLVKNAYSETKIDREENLKKQYVQQQSDKILK